MDGRRAKRYVAPPYILFSEALGDDCPLGPGTHTVKVRARDGGGCLKRDFEVEYARAQPLRRLLRMRMVQSRFAAAP